MAFSIRTRLTFWYVTLLTISIVAFVMSFFYVLSKVYIGNVDKEINSIAATMAHTIVMPTGELRLPKNFDVILERFFGIRIGGNYIQVMDSKGNMAAKSSTLEGFILPLSEESYDRAKSGETVYEVVRPFGVYPVRVVIKPIIMRDYGFRAIIMVGGSLEGMEAIFHRMTYFFAFGFIASVVIAGVVGWFLAKKALAPVDGMTRLARKISAENLNERLSIKGPKDELSNLASTINEMIARLESSFKQITQFTADASHELKTPLTIMKGEIEVLLRGRPTEEELKTLLASLLEEIDRMTYIVKNLLALAMVDRGKETLPRAIVSFDGIVSDVFEQTRKIALEKGIEIDIARNTPLKILGDPVGLGQVVFNLVDNAIKYTQRGGSVTVMLEESGGYAILTVKDTGVSIPEEDIPYIFDRFYRVDRARTRDEAIAPTSVGLGLSICKEIVESFDGVITVESKAGRGSVFTVRIPVAIIEVV